jgi:predicted secreted protein
MPIEGTAVQGYNYEILFGGSDTDISGQSNKIGLSPTKNIDEVTPFGVTWRAKISGIKDWKGSIQVIYNEETNEAFDLLWDAYNGSSSSSLKLSPKGGSTGDYQWSGSVHISEISHEASPDGGAIVASVSFEGTGTLSYAAVS